jgi:hypothetical protein
MIPHRGVDRLASLAEQVLRDDRQLFQLTERKDFSVALLSDRLEEVKKHPL